jgi:PAS domain S-box-containing protein
LARRWLGWAVGVLALAPPLLVALTPWLVRVGAVPPPARAASHSVGEPPGRRGLGDWLEVAGLALGTGLFEVALVTRAEVGPWQIWGVPLLLTAWASLRQGLRGGLLVAGSAAVLALLAAAWLRPTPLPPLPALLVPGNLIAQCSIGLLVASSTSWVRASEGQYRRVVGHIPVLLYSARVDRPVTAGPEPRGADATPLGTEITFASPASADLLGRPPEELLGDYSLWLAHVHPDDRELLLAAISQVGRQDAPVTIEYRLAPGLVTGRGTGSSARPAESKVISHAPPRERPRWVRHTLAPHHDEAGRLTGWEGVVTEITEQRLLADDLRRTTTMFHGLVANLPAGVFFVQGPAGVPLLVNARARQLLGQREDASAGLDHLPAVYRLHRPDGTPYPVAELPVALALRNGLTTMRDDIVVHRPDGRRMPLVTWAAPIDLAGQGRPTAAVWVFEDASSLRAAESALRAGEARLRVVIENVADGLLVHDHRGAVVDCNPAARAILNRPADRLLGRRLDELEGDWLDESGRPLTAPEGPAAVCLRTGEAVRDRIFGYRPAGEGADSVRWFLVNAVPVPAAGSVPGSTPAQLRVLSSQARVVITLADVTAHLQVLAALRHSEAEQRGLVEALPLGLFQADREMRVIACNPAAVALTGFTAAQLRDPATWQALVHPDDLPGLLALYARALQGETGRMEMRYRARGDLPRVGLAIIQPRLGRSDGGGAVVGITALLIDLTRERQLEQELQRAGRLELVGRLAGGIAHDFNNLLSVVTTLTGVAARKLAEDHPARTELGLLEDAATQLAALSGQLLAFSRGAREGGSRDRPARRVEVNQVARRTLELLRRALPRSIDLEPELAAGELPVLGDETQLQQVLMNLCLNARDAMPEGGRLVVRTEAVPPGEGPNGQAPAAGVRLTVADTGQGMPEEVRAQVFDPFFTTKQNGTGLGLAVVWQIVTGHGGQVDVWSRPGEGSRFAVWLPAADE